jgi:hypothetical protein
MYHIGAYPIKHPREGLGNLRVAVKTGKTITALKCIINGINFYFPFLPVINGIFFPAGMANAVKNIDIML